MHSIELTLDGVLSSVYTCYIMCGVESVTNSKYPKPIWKL